MIELLLLAIGYFYVYFVFAIMSVIANVDPNSKIYFRGHLAIMLFFSIHIILV